MISFDDKNLRNSIHQLCTIKNQDNDLNQNPIIALLKGPDNLYRNLLSEDNEKLDVPMIDDQNKSSCLEINIRSLSIGEQKRLLKWQYRQLYKRHCESMKRNNRYLHFTFPIVCSCPMKIRRKRLPSMISKKSFSTSSFQDLLKKKTNEAYLSRINRLKSVVSISCDNDKSNETPMNPIRTENHLSLSLLKIPSKHKSTNKMCSYNAYSKTLLCQLCGSVLSNGICSCIVSNLLKLNNTKDQNISGQLKNMCENLTINNIIT